MTISPLPRTRLPVLRSSLSSARRTPTAAAIVRRGQTVAWTKRLLPLVALLLLASIALWPQIVRQTDLGGLSYGRGLSGDLQAGKLVNMRYRGLNARNRPYTVTASQADQVGPDQIDLVDPKGDTLSENGSWTLSQSLEGVYMQHAGLLDLSKDVVLYRDDGITLRTEAATVDLKTGVAASNLPTHIEGPFGTLDAQGFTLVDKGAVIQFPGRARLLLNGTTK